MKNSIILAGAAALAIAGPAFAQPKGQGGGPKDGGGPAKVERGGGGPKAERGRGPQRAERREARGPERREVRGPERREARQERRAERQERRERGPVQAVGADRERGKPARAERRAERRELDRRDVERREVRNADRAEVRREDRDRFTAYPVATARLDRTGLVGGCPPGLAAKNNGCLPPGQAKKLVGAAIPATLGGALLPPLYRSWYPDDDDHYYRFSDGYAYRIDRDRDLVDAFFPLADDWTGAYYVGAPYPQDYLGYYNVPAQYEPWYADSGDDYYRYGDGAIYRVDRQGGLIEAIVSLLAGGVAVGQPLPAGYDVYNVPFDYRDRYVDGPDNWYRYNDGHIYQVDPTTRLVEAIVETLS